MEQPAQQQMEKILFADSVEEAQNIYSKWSREYDEDVLKMRTVVDVELARMFQKWAKNEPKVLLDLAGGTGRIVKHLREDGYTGIVDILDANMDMLEVAERRKLDIRNIYRHFVQEDGVLPLKDDTYDAITSGAAFLPNHIPITAIRGVLKVLKVGGLFFIVIRKKSLGRCREQFDDIVEDLQKTGQIEVLESTETKHVNPDSPQVDLFCLNFTFKRLK